MSKFNKSHLNNAFILKILKACRLAMKQGIEHVYNSKGHCVLAIRWRAGKFWITDINDCSLCDALLRRSSSFGQELKSLYLFVFNNVVIKPFNK